jgi:chromosome segregation ATPase
MKSRKTSSPPVFDQAALSDLHNSILGSIAELDKLNAEFKVKQEHHFLRTFMGVLERMGKDLILAQEAYRNIDIDIKRERYYQELSTELSFFKN